MNMTRRPTVLSSDELLHRVLSPATPLLYNTVQYVIGLVKGGSGIPTVLVVRRKEQHQVRSSLGPEMGCYFIHT
jgi:hypothetical protein